MTFENDLVRTVQSRLADLSFYTGTLDGDAGPLTQSAVSAFKQANGLRARPYPGPITLKTLFSDSAKAKPAPEPKGDEPAWMAEARTLLGVREKSGKGSNPVILDWADDLDLHYPDDDIPWCGLFVAHCMRVGAPAHLQPGNVLGARNWLKFGTQCQPVVGSILVFWRGSKNGWQGHVGFYAGEDATAYHVLGGNQSNAVTITRIAKSRLLGARWPNGEPITTGTFKSSLAGTLSVNEA